MGFSLRRGGHTLEAVLLTPARLNCFAAIWESEWCQCLGRILRELIEPHAESPRSLLDFERDRRQDAVLGKSRNQLLDFNNA